MDSPPSIADNEMQQTDTKILFVIGPQRAGTTWLHQAFEAQPKDVFINRAEKEDYWFLRSRSDIASSRQRFLAQRIGIGECRLVVDACPVYLGNAPAIGRILDHFPDAYFAYVYRPIEAREKSYRAHQQLNRRASRIIGYPLSNELFESQSDIAAIEDELTTLVRPTQLVRLEFAELAEENGQRWIHILSDFLDVSIEPVELGKVNAKRAHDDQRWQWYYFGVRVLQVTRAHIVARKLRIRLQARKAGINFRRADNAWIGGVDV